VILGVLLGVAVSVYSFVETLKITIAKEEVELIKFGETKTIARSEINSVFLDGKNLVLLGHDSKPLYNGKTDSQPERLATAFRQHNYPWANGDPFSNDYRRWVPELPDISIGAHALFKARAHAIKNNDVVDIADLSKELEKLDIVVRDKNGHQYWRKTRSGQALIQDNDTLQDQLADNTSSAKVMTEEANKDQ